MDIVSSDRIVLIGPGSEWFWAMAQFAVVAVTLVGIYFQFRLQRAANAFDQMSRIQAEWNSEQFTRIKLSGARAVKAGNPMPLAAMVAIGNFWESVGTLVRLGHVDPRLVYDSLGNSSRFWWALMEDGVRGARAESESSDLLVRFEWLAGVFARFAERDGAQADFTRAGVIEGIGEQIEAMEDRLRLLEASRAIPPRVRSPRRSVPAADEQASR